MPRKTVLCYGDSNTWGRSPFAAERLPQGQRWPDVLEDRLGSPYRVISEGLNGRTTVWDDPIEEHRCGKTYLAPCLLSHMPVDIVVLMLGTNDLKKRFSVSAFDIGRSVGVLLDLIVHSGCGPRGGTPQVVLVCPPPLGELSDFAEMFEGGAEKSRSLARYYQEHAGQRGCRFLDAGEIIRSSDADGIHFEPEQHVKLGEALGAVVAAM